MADKLIYFCLGCKSVYSEYDKPVVVCPDCGINMIKTNYFLDEWRSKDSDEKNRIKSDIYNKHMSSHDNEKVALKEQNSSDAEKKKIVQQRRDEFKRYYASLKAEEYALFDIKGCRGRSIHVYDDRAVIITDVTLGSILTDNATDGEKTIFYSDVIGLQFKEPGLTIGYLQLETASGQMNNLKSNAFSENTFTFETLTEEIIDMKNYVFWEVAQRKPGRINI